MSVDVKEEVVQRVKPTFDKDSGILPVLLRVVSITYNGLLTVGFNQDLKVPEII